MATQVTLSVNGRDGIDVAGNRDDHLVPFQIIGVVPGAAGRPGVDAPPANQGEHAGMVQVELKRSATQQGWIQLRALKQRGSKWISPDTEIPPRTKILFTAIGGMGEPGRTGGNGEGGSPGTDGADATRESDATEGGPGGAGGNAGSGSNGATGGNGGFVQLVIDEDDLDILYGMDCDVSGGKGGDAGKHGVPGNGGQGGKGGQPIVWEDIVDTKHKCTSSCIGGSTSNAVLGNQRDATMEMFRRFQEQTSGESSLNRTIATIATASRVRSAARPGGQGVCKCRGGSGTCAGCLVCPVYQTFSRSTGRCGPEGSPGIVPRDFLVPGEDGDPGRLSIVVRRKNGQALEGSTNYRLKLVGFDVEDGNSDGIFEPGEDIFIRRIQIQNPGGVISPSRLISCTLAIGEGVIDGDDALDATRLPTSIPPGATYTSTVGEELSSRLLSVTISSASLPPYRKELSVALKATMPWTMLPVEDFGLSKSILVQFPIEMKEVKAAASVVAGNRTSLSWKIFNKSLRSFGTSLGNGRLAKVVAVSDNEHVQLHNQDGTWARKSTLVVPLVQPSSTVEMRQYLHPDANIVQHCEVNVSFQLFISSPLRPVFTDDLETSEMQLIETHQVKIQVTPGYASTTRDDVLLVTNSASRTRDIDALLNLLQMDLSLKVNIWNVSTYGGLLTQDQECLDELNSILAQYEGRTVILLANAFPLIQADKMTTISLCDPFSMLAVSQSNTSCLFFGFSNSDKERKDLDHLFRPVDGEAISLMEALPTEAKHKSFESLVQSLIESGSRCNRTHLVTIFKSRMNFRDDKMMSSARRLAEMLRSEIPLYHFAMCMIPKQDSDAENIDCHLLVQFGLPRTVLIQAVQAELLKATEYAAVSELKINEVKRRPTRIRRAPTSLSSSDKLKILGGLSITKRMEILDRPNRQVPSDIVSLIELSVEQQIDEELQSFVDAIGTIKLKGGIRDRFLRESLPSTSQLIDHITDTETLSEETRLILAHCFAGCRPQSKSKVISEGMNPFSQARKLTRKLLEESVGSTKDLGLDESSLRKQRRVSSSITERVNLVTGQSPHSQQNSNYGLVASLEKNDILSVEEWNDAARRARAMETSVVELHNDFHREYETLEGFSMSAVNESTPKLA